MIIVQKFGGTSVGTKQRIKSLKNIIKKYKNSDIKIIIILSAMSGETSKMLKIAKYFKYKKLKSIDFMLCIGEQMSVSLFNLLLNSVEIQSIPLISSQIGFITNNNYSNARIILIKNISIIKKILKKKQIPVLTGFQGITLNGNLTTLGRGGSDTTAVVISIYLKAKECQIYSDVKSIFISDPRICYNYKINFIPFENILELSSLGSKILFVRSIELARKYNVNIRLLSSFFKKKGTYISKKKKFINSMERTLISGISYTSNEVRITVANIPNVPGVLSKILGPIISNGICIDMVIQNSLNYFKFTNFTFLIEEFFFKKAIYLIKKFFITKIGGRVEYERYVSKISIIGIGLRSHNHIIGKIFYSMSKLSINIILVSTSETKISILIKKKFTILAIKNLYKIFNKQFSLKRNG
ncbi:aspartate kinase [Candidatus Carsonella ruddii]|uniref:Aspartokinase n=1 Tax=Candidatus Carsonella ruddii PC isolate NHV TaxID=1202540 RepID=J3VQV8_CARRU|nr:aspartate kinase [Candidatus Carsonella ruddii]AFP84336.1 aspartokinase [Candidatus Carsonella ruddii PC isolate NHV]